MTTKTRKPEARSMRYDPESQMLCLFAKGVGTAFAVFELPCEEGGRRVFRLGKSDLSEKYTVSLIGDGSASECDCAGGTYRGGCRHQDAMRTLLQLGKLGVAPVAKRKPKVATTFESSGF